MRPSGECDAHEHHESDVLKTMKDNSGEIISTGDLDRLREEIDKLMLEYECLSPIAVKLNEPMMEYKKAIYSTSISDSDLDELRRKIDEAMLQPDYHPIVVDLNTGEGWRHWPERRFFVGLQFHREDYDSEEYNDVLDEIDGMGDISVSYDVWYTMMKIPRPLTIFFDKDGTVYIGKEMENANSPLSHEDFMKELKKIGYKPDDCVSLIYMLRI